MSPLECALMATPANNVGIQFDEFETEKGRKTSRVSREVSRQHQQPSRHGDSYYCEKDLYVQIQTSSILYNSAFYYEHASSAEAKVLLKSCAVGTFLVRNSSDPNYLYTISVKTKRGPTSIRILYEHGRFSLDADETVKHKMPTFPSLMELIDFYERLAISKSSDQCGFLDRKGKKDVELPVSLKKPRLNAVPLLKHLCRLTINRELPARHSKDVKNCLTQLHLADHVPLPKPIVSYLKDYPFLH